MEASLPIYYFAFDENGNPQKGISAIAAVDRPAILTEWLAFDENKKKDRLEFAIQSEEKRIVTGPILIPDLPVYRKLDDYEYYVAATADVIQKLAFKFMRENRNDRMKDTHAADNETTPGFFIFESFIVDPDRGISAPKGFDVPAGTWFISCRVENDEIWQKVKDKTFNGFSMEGFIDMQLTDLDIPEDLMQEIIDSIVE